MSGSIRGYRFRFRPTLRQRRHLSRAFGQSRYVWNWALATKRDAWKERQENVPFAELSRRLTALRQELPWLREVDRQVQQSALRDLDRAYQNFFAKRARFPKFKSRFGPQKVRFQFDHRQTGKASAWANRVMVLPGLGTCRLVDSLDEWPAMPKLVTVSRDASGDYWVSFAAEGPALAQAPDRMLGVDVGITDLAVTSDGWKSGQVTKLREHAALLKRYQRMVSRRQKGSNRRAAAKLRLARLHRDIAHTRKDFCHKTSHRIATSANVVVLETLNVKGMLRNHNLARSLSDAALSELHRQIAYKVVQRGGTVIRVDRWEPTSKVCSACGCMVEKLPLSVRHWTCPDCGSQHDRDVNAAKVLLALGRGTPSKRGDRGGSGASALVPLDEPRISAAAELRLERRNAA